MQKNGDNLQRLSSGLVQKDGSCDPSVAIALTGIDESSGFTNDYTAKFQGDADLNCHDAEGALYDDDDMNYVRTGNATAVLGLGDSVSVAELKFPVGNDGTSLTFQQGHLKWSGELHKDYFQGSPCDGVNDDQCKGL